MNGASGFECIMCKQLRLGALIYECSIVMYIYGCMFNIHVLL